MQKSKYGEVELSGSTIIVGLFIFISVLTLTICLFFENVNDYRTKIEITYQDNSKEIINYDKMVLVNLEEGDLKIDNCTERSSVKSYIVIESKK